MNQNIVELKLQQRLLRAELTQTAKKLEKCSVLLVTRKAKKLERAQINEARQKSRDGAHALRAMQDGEHATAYPDDRKGRALVSFMASPSHPKPRLQGASVSIPATLSSLRSKQFRRGLELTREHELKEKERHPPGPGKAGAYRKNPLPISMFPIRYARGELPCTVDHISTGLALSWTAPLPMLDFEVYLPVFVEGLVNTSHPYAFMARQGCREILAAAAGRPEWIIPSL